MSTAKKSVRFIGTRYKIQQLVKTQGRENEVIWMSKKCYFISDCIISIKPNYSTLLFVTFRDIFPTCYFLKVS